MSALPKRFYKKVGSENLNRGPALFRGKSPEPIGSRANPTHHGHALSLRVAPTAAQPGMQGLTACQRCCAPGGDCSAADKGSPGTCCGLVTGVADILADIRDLNVG